MTDRLHVTADLRLDLDGVPATLTGDGDRLVLETGDPRALWSTITKAGLPAGVGRVSAARAVGRLASGLRDAGVSVEIRGPRGPLVSLGDGVRSVAGRVTTGSDALRPGGPGALGPLVLSSLRRPAVLVGALAALAGAVAVAVRRR
jgi:hypothetical protein